MDQIQKKFPNIQFIDEQEKDLVGLPSMIKVRHCANKNAAGELRGFGSFEEFKALAKNSSAKFFARFKPVSL